MSDNAGNGTVKVQCPGCKTNLEIDEDYYKELAGTSISCPSCSAAVQVPAASPQAAPKAGKHVFSLPKKHEPQAAGHKATQKCSGCGAEAGADAVICIQCGMNFKTGKKVTTTM